MTCARFTPLVILSALAAQAPEIPDISYDPKAPLALEESPVKDFGFARMLDISYASPRGGQRDCLRCGSGQSRPSRRHRLAALGSGRPLQPAARGVKNGTPRRCFHTDKFAH